MITSIPIPKPRPKTTPESSCRYTARQWDEIRRAFYSSILADTPLSSLSKNLEGVEWPIQGPGEIPSAYLELSFQELHEHLALRGQPPGVADFLMDILQETMDFDNPFGDMINQAQSSGEGQNPLVRNLAKLNIPAEFPVALTALSAETLLFCRLEHIATLEQFALAAQRMAGSVIVGGDFRALLNALSCIDERVLARYLPYRVGSTGLHYIEGVAHAIRALPAPVQAALARRLGLALPAASLDMARSVSLRQIEQAKLEIRVNASAMRGFCEQDYEDVQNRITKGEDIRELVAVLGDHVTAAIVADIIAPSASRAGFLARVLRWWRK